MVMVDAEEVRAHQRLAGDAMASNKIRPGTLKRKFKVSQGVK